MSQQRFGQRLAHAVDAYGPLCVGIDPHPGTLNDWGLAASAGGVREFGLRLVEAAASTAGIVKPQSAFFEEYGAAGIAALEDVLAAAHEASLLTILDAKRGDIGSTMSGYARAYLADGPLAADALTVSPFLGFGSLLPALEVAARHGRGVFVLALTSNPEGRSVQHATTPAGSSVAADIIAQISSHNAAATSTGLGDVGIVAGATIGQAAANLGIEFADLGGPILAPGFGAQGGSVHDLTAVFGDAFAHGQVIVNSSRGISAAGPDIAALKSAIRATTATLRS